MFLQVLELQKLETWKNAGNCYWPRNNRVARKQVFPNCALAFCIKSRTKNEIILVQETRAPFWGAFVHRALKPETVSSICSGFECLQIKHLQQTKTHDFGVNFKCGQKTFLCKCLKWKHSEPEKMLETDSGLWNIGARWTGPPKCVHLFFLRENMMCNKFVSLLIRICVDFVPSLYHSVIYAVSNLYQICIIL